MTTPAWSAPINGMPGNLDATNSSTGINQFLGAHGVVPVYKGTQILTPAGAQNFLWTAYGNTADLSQPFTMSGTAIGRVEVPLQPNGNGADVLVSLYSDTGGSPNIAAGAVCSTLLPAQYLNQVCAPDGLASGGPLASPANNTMYGFGGAGAYVPWPAPASGANGISSNAALAVSGNYMILAGGNDGVATNHPTFSTVNTAQYVGGGLIAPPVPQPALPVSSIYGSITTTSSFVIYLGGTNITSAGVQTVITNTYVAGWNPNTGVIGSWSQQTALPVANTGGAATTWNNAYVYLAGGSSTTSVSGLTNAVYFASISNGQLGSWTATSALPTALEDIGLAVVGNWIFAFGGLNSGVNDVTSVYYAAINPATGSVGAWQTGPSLPTAWSPLACGMNQIVGDAFVATWGGSTNGAPGITTAIQVLPVTAQGPADHWTQSNVANHGGLFETSYIGAFASGQGAFDIIDLNASGSSLNQYFYAVLGPVPMMSVPLPATGLTNGATYHVVLRQFSSTSASDYVAFGTLDGTPLPSAALTHGRYQSGSWTSVGAGRSVPMSVFDQTVGGSVLHTWEDANTLDMGGTAARWSSLLYNSQGLLWGAAEVTTQPNLPLNSNPTFTSGVSPWTAVNGTITQSSAQTHGGYPFSGLLTPTGGFTTAAALSELFPVEQTLWGSAQWVMAMGWFYSPTGWSSFSLSVNWYDSSKTLISTSSATVSLAAATWTQANNWFQPPATAAYAQLAPTESGSPGATNLLYMSYVYDVLTPETVGAQTSAATVNYKTGSYWPPIGVTQLN